MKKLILILTLAWQAHAYELPVTFLKAIHQVETGGRLGPIKGDNGKALGPLQIHYGYWLDSGITGDYSQCGSYEYASKVVTAYLNRYAPKAIESHNYEALARIHNGGPAGNKNKKTLDYWRKVRHNLY